MTCVPFDRGWALSSDSISSRFRNLHCPPLSGWSGRHQAEIWAQAPGTRTPDGGGLACPQLWPGCPISRGTHTFGHSSIATCPRYQGEKGCWHMPSWTGRFSQGRIFREAFSEHVSYCAENVMTFLGPTGGGTEQGQAGGFSAFAKSQGTCHQLHSSDLTSHLPCPDIGLRRFQRCVSFHFDSSTKAAPSAPEAEPFQDNSRKILNYLTALELLVWPCWIGKFRQGDHRPWTLGGEGDGWRACPGAHFIHRWGKTWLGPAGYCQFLRQASVSKQLGETSFLGQLGK